VATKTIINFNRVSEHRRGFNLRFYRKQSRYKLCSCPSIAAVAMTIRFKLPHSTQRLHAFWIATAAPNRIFFRLLRRKTQFKMNRLTIATLRRVLNLWLANVRSSHGFRNLAPNRATCKEYNWKRENVEQYAVGGV